MKSILATSALAALVLAGGNACAQSATQVYGLLDMWAGRSGISGAGPATTQVNSGGMQTSYWGFAGGEDLGGGLKVVYAIEGYLQLDTGAAGRTNTDAMFARNAFVGLQGRAGELKLGRILNPLFVATAQSNPFGGSIRFAPLLAQVWSPTMGRAVSGDTSWDNVVSYTTPALYGFRLAALASLGETTFGVATRNDGLFLHYASGPAVAWVVAQRARVGPGLARIGESEQRTVFAGGSYDLGKAKLFASWDSADSRRPDLKARTAQAGVAVPAGGGSVMLSFARTDIDVAAGADNRRDTGAVGYDYFLSRRTDLYAVAQTDRLRSANRANTYGVGIRHKF
ncbi:porin [uncultured Massilia sp.]|uniref:porin n=1 Tax=uncultured Massilia sp. TaxID=169973 RepID=UPI0025CF221A|nr:porin [uncultured Massilia sp.]